MPLKHIMGRPLSAEDVSAAADKLGVSDAHLHAVIAVEASGSGFLPLSERGARLPKILFEAHIFSRETGGRYDRDHPQLSSPQWNRELYRGGRAEYQRLKEAARLDFEAAYRATSWGLFQIMGFNHRAAGYERLEDFIGVQFVSESLQLQCGANFMLSHGLDVYLRRNDWEKFARGYNGPAYEENRYHEKLASAFERFQPAPPPVQDADKALQIALNRAGFNLTVDGVLGSRTEAAIREFQEREGLVVDGIAGPNTLSALGLA